MPDTAYVCPACGRGLERDLRELAELADDTPARAAQYGVGARSGGEQPLPFNPDASDRLAAIASTVTTWCRHVAETRGRSLPSGGNRPTAVAAAWLGRHDNVEWLRHRQEAERAFAELTDACRDLRRLVDRKATRRYLGPCGAPQFIEAGDDDDEVGRVVYEIEGPPCTGDVYVREHATTGACDTCGGVVDAAERRMWLDETVRGHAFRIVQIADAFGIKANTISQWVARGRLVPHGHDGEGRPLVNVGEVLDLAAQDAARRATNQAKAARRRDRNESEAA
jgi:transposase